MSTSRPERCPSSRLSRRNPTESRPMSGPRLLGMPCTPAQSTCSRTPEGAYVHGTCRVRPTECVAGGDRFSCADLKIRKNPRLDPEGTPRSLLGREAAHFGEMSVPEARRRSRTIGSLAAQATLLLKALAWNLRGQPLPGGRGPGEMLTSEALHPRCMRYAATASSRARAAGKSMGTRVTPWRKLVMILSPITTMMSMRLASE